MVAIQALEANAPRILITEPIAQEGIDLLRYELPDAYIDVRLDLSPEHLLALIGSYTILIVRSQTTRDRRSADAAPHLQIIGRAGSGLDNIDLDAAIQHGVLVVHAPRGNTIAVSEHTMSLLLALARHLPAANSSIKAGRWDKSRLLGVELHQKVLGIIGLGRVGTEVAQKAQAFGMRVIASDPLVSPKRAQQVGVTLHSKDEVLQRADFVTLHASLTEDKEGMRKLIGARELSLLKPGAYLVNCARGNLVDEQALLAALTEGRLAGVALDVFSQEPIGDDTVLRQLLAHERVIATPHLGASTVEAQVQSRNRGGQEHHLGPARRYLVWCGSAPLHPNNACIAMSTRKRSFLSIKFEMNTRKETNGEYNGIPRNTLFCRVHYLPRVTHRHWRWTLRPFTIWACRRWRSRPSILKASPRSRCIAR